MIECLPYDVLALILTQASAPDPVLIIEPRLDLDDFKRGEAAGPSSRRPQQTYWSLHFDIYIPSVDRQFFLARACLVSKRWYDVATRLLYRQPMIKNWERRHLFRPLWRTIVESPHLAEHIKMLDLSLCRWEEAIGYDQKSLLRERVPQLVRQRYEDHATMYGRLVKSDLGRDFYEKSLDGDEEGRRSPTPEFIRRMRVGVNETKSLMRDRRRHEWPAPADWTWTDAMEECMEAQTCVSVLLTFLPNLTHLEIPYRDDVPICVGATPGSLSNLIWAQLVSDSSARITLPGLACLAIAAPNLKTLVIQMPHGLFSPLKPGPGYERKLDPAQMPVFEEVTCLCLIRGFISMDERGFQKLAICFPRLEKLDILRPVNEVEPPPAPNKPLLDLARHIPTVRYLRIGATYSGIGPDLQLVIAFLARLKSLQHLWVPVTCIELDTQQGLVDLLPSSIQHVTISVEMTGYNNISSSGLNRDEALLLAIQELGRQAGLPERRFPELRSVAVINWAFHGYESQVHDMFSSSPDPERTSSVERTAATLLANGVKLMLEGPRPDDLWCEEPGHRIVSIFGSHEGLGMENMFLTAREPETKWTMAHWGQGWIM